MFSFKRVLTYFLPAYTIGISLLIFFYRKITNKLVERMHSYRQAQISDIVKSWNCKKSFPMNLRWGVGEHAAWLELTHDVKENAVYTDFANHRGFSADSDISPTKNMLSPNNINKFLCKNTEPKSLVKSPKDSWSGLINTQTISEKEFSSLAPDNISSPGFQMQLIKPIKCKDFWNKDRISDISEIENSDSICSIHK